MNKICQSCGMPLKSDVNQGGTNKDGSKNQLYCSYCYQNGAFTQPNITVEEMQTFGKMKMKEMGFVMGLFGGMFSKQIPKLQRWNQSN
jgi:hypothetical protein